MKQRPLQHAARLSPIIFVFFLAQQRAKKWARAGNGMVLKQEALPLQRLENGRALRRHSQRGGKRILWGVDVDLYDSVVAVPKSSFVTRRTATFASISVPPAGPFARRPQPRLLAPIKCQHSAGHRIP